MADLNPQLQPITADYTRSSQGYKADTSLGGLLDDTASLLTGGVKAAQSLFKMAIDKEAYEAADAVRDEEIRSALSQSAGEAPVVPSTLTGAVDRMNTLKSAREAGTIGGAHYELLLDAEARKLRARYPGHRDYIDQKFSEITGSTPANKAITQLRSEVNKDPDKALYNHALNWSIEHGTPGIADILAQGQKPSLEMLLAANSQHGKTLADEQSLDRKLTRDKKVRDQMQDETEITAQKGLFARLDQKGGAILSNSGITWDSLQATAKEAGGFLSQGAPVPKDVEDRLRAQLIQYEMDANKQFDDYMFKEVRKDGNGQDFTYAQVLGQDKIERIRNAYNNRLKDQLEPIRNKDLGLISANTAWIKASENSELAKLYQSSDWGLRMKTLRSVLGDQATSMWLSKNAENLSAQQKLMMDYLTTGLTKNTSFTNDLSEAEKVARDSGMSPQQIGQFKGRLIERYIGMLQDPSVPQQAKNAIVQKVFGGNPEYDDFYAKASSDRTRQPNGEFTSEREILYSKLLNPIAAKQIFDTGNPDTIARYTRWVDNAFGGRMRDNVDETRNVTRINSPFQLAYDTNTHRFGVVNRPVAGPQQEMLRDTATETRVRRLAGYLNQTVAGWEPTAKLTGMNDDQINSYIARQFEAGGLQIPGLQPSQPQAPKPTVEMIQQQERSLANPGIRPQVNTRSVPTETIPVPQRKSQNRVPTGEDKTAKEFTDRVPPFETTTTLTPEDIAAQPQTFTQANQPPAGLKVVESNGKFYVLPTTTYGGQTLNSDKEIMDYYRKSGKFYGIYGNKEDADNQQATLMQAFSRLNRPATRGF